MHVIGEETSERLDVIPAQFRVIVLLQEYEAKIAALEHGWTRRPKQRNGQPRRPAQLRLRYEVIRLDHSRNPPQIAWRPVLDEASATAPSNSSRISCQQRQGPRGWEIHSFHVPRPDRLLR